MSNKMKESYSSIETGAKELSGIKPLLDEWIEVVKTYSDYLGNADACYWYNERASLSALAGAAWRLNGKGKKWCALEEFRTTKHYLKEENKSNKKGIKNGRCDLWIGSPRKTFAIEAKQAWQQIHNDGSLDKVKLALRSAKSDASKLQSDEADVRLGLVFIIPSFERETDSNVLSNWLKNLKELTTKRGWAAFAYVFPPKNRKLHSEQNKRIYPGVVLAARLIHRGVRKDKGTRRKPI